MTINPNNFEAYLLDYLEGNLNPLLTAELMAFLAENPEFEKYIPDFEALPITASDINFQNKELLKKDYSQIKHINDHNFDEFCIAFYEGLLEPADAERLNEYTSRHPEKKKDFEIYKWAKLQPDFSITFNEKSLLKKSPAKPSPARYLYYSLAIAASLAFLVWFTGNRQPASNPQPEMIREQLAEKTMPEIHIAVPHEPVRNKQVKTIQGVNSRQEAASEIIPAPVQNRETILLSSLEPISPALQTHVNLPPPQRQLIPVVEPSRPGLFAELFKSDSFLQTLVSRIDFWKTAETAIEGINYLTESQLSISRTVDENGNLTSLLVNTESYTIEGIKAR